LKQALTALRPQRAMPLWLFSVLIVAPVLVFGLLKLILVLTHKEATAAARMAARAQKALKQAAAGNLPNEAFLSSLYQALTAAILSRADSMGASLTWKEARDILTSTGYDPDQAQQAARLLEQIETSSYSGASLGVEETSQLLAATRKTIRSLLK